MVEWEMLRRCGHVVHGPPVSDLHICDASSDLGAFSLRNLVDLLGALARSYSAIPSGKRPS